MLESTYQAQLIERLESMFLGCIVIRLDPRFVDVYIDGEKFSQGVMDLLVLFRGRWATLEVKSWSHARRRPNQDYFISAFDRLSFAAFICPENEEVILDDLQRALRPRRVSRVS